MRQHLFPSGSHPVRAFFAVAAGLLVSLSQLQGALIGFHSFDDPANPLKDDSGNANDLQSGLGGAPDPVYVPDGGFEGGGYVFDGGQHLVSPININTAYLPSLTMGAWVKTSSLAAGLRKIMGHDDGGYDRAFGLDTRNGPFRYCSFIGTGDPPPGSPSPESTNDWTFIAVTYDEFNAQMTLYVDLDSLSINDELHAASSPTGFGSGQDTLGVGSIRPDDATEGWLGAMDNVFFYDEVLTVEQLTAIRNGGKGAILGSNAENPDLRVVAEPQLRNLPKSPAVLSFTYGIKNVGASEALTLSAVTVAGADAARYHVVHFPATIAPGSIGTIEFTFDSQSQVGGYSAVLVIESNDPSDPTVWLDISAQVGDDPDLVIVSSPNLQDLAKLPPNQTLVFNIRNGGVFDTLRINTITLSGLDSTYYAVKSFPQTLAPGATGMIEFSFNPQGQVGSFAAMANIECNDASSPTMNLDLSARVTGTALLGFYSFDDTNDPQKDESGNGRALQSAGELSNPSYAADGGVQGGSFVFDGGQRLVVPLNINPNQIPVLTMGAWVKTSALDPGLYKAIGHDDGGWDRVIGLDDRAQAAGGPMPAGIYRYVVFTGENNHGPIQGDPAPTPESSESWTFLAAVYDQPNSLVTLYVDLDVATTDDEPQAISDAAPMGSGASTTAIGAIAPGGGEGWVGSIDNVFFLGGRTDAALVKSVRDQGKQALLQLRPDPVLVAPPDLVFGTAPVSSSQPTTASLAIRNAGQTQPLNIIETRITGRSASRYTLSDVPGTIAPGDTAIVKVTFDPQGQEGNFEATLDVISNSTSDRHARFDLAVSVAFGSPLIAFYPFDDPTDPLRNATGKGSALITPADAAPIYQESGGIEGGAFDFSGSQRLVAPININASALPQLTMGAWVKTATLDAGMRKVIGQDNGGWDRVIGLDNRDGPFRYTSFTGVGSPLVGAPGPESTQAWTFLAATYDQDLNTLALYVDPDVSSTGDPLTVVETSTGFTSGLTTTAIGGVSPASADEGWQGSIDNVFFYQTVLSLAELTNIRDQGAAAIAPPLAPRPRITQVRKTANLAITWTSVSSKTYIVEYTEKLAGPWTQIATLPGQNTTTTYTDTDATRLGRSLGFYRVGVLP